MIAAQVNRWWWMEQNPHVLPVSVTSLRKYSPEVPVIVIGDNPQIASFGCEFVPIKDFSKLSDRFDKVYKHGGPLPEIWQKFTIARWLVMADWVEKEKIRGPIFTCDHDVLTFCNWLKEGYRYAKADYTSSYIDAGSYAACEGFINKPAEVLRGFAEFIIKYFQDKHVDGHQVNDMDAWLKYGAAHQKLKWQNTAAVIDGAMMDRNVAQSYMDFEHDGKTKLITFENGVPYCRNMKTGKKVRFLSLHCWGPWKNRMQYIMDCAAKSAEQKRPVPLGTVT